MKVKFKIFTMKKIFFILLVFVSVRANAGNSDTVKVRKHEIGFGFTNLYGLFSQNSAGSNSNYLNHQDDYGPNGFEFGSGSNAAGGYVAYNNFINFFNPGYGVSYKYHIKQKEAVRLGLDFSNINSQVSGTSSDPSYPDSIYKYNIHSTKLVFKIGYQFEKKIKRILVYGGADVFYYNNKSDYDIDGAYSSSGYLETGKSNITGFGVTPFGGVVFVINELFSISTESRLRFGSYSLTESYSGISSTLPFSGSVSGKSTETKFSPLGLISFNIHL